MNPLHPVYLRDLDGALDNLAGRESLQGAALLVTGATGMIGSCLIDLLARMNRRFAANVRVYALCRDARRGQARFAAHPEVEVLAGDVVAPPELPKADFIVHAASNAHPLAFSGDPVGTMKANLLGTMNLLEHLRAQDKGRLLFVSTGEIYGENPAVTDGFREDGFGRIDPMSPRSCYPESKRAAETLCASYVRQYGLDAVVARLCYVYGPTASSTSSRADAQFLFNALAGKNIVLKSAGSQLRSYCYAADAAAALLTILLRGSAGEAYNVANRASVHTIRDYAETLAKAAGVQIAFDLPPEKERQGYSAVTRAVQDPSKLEALGWRGIVPLETGLRHTLEILGRSPV